MAVFICMGMATGHGTKPEAQYTCMCGGIKPIARSDLTSHVGWSNSARVLFLDPLVSNVTRKLPHQAQTYPR